MGLHLAGATEHNMSVRTQGMCDMMSHVVESGTYETVEVFKDGKAVHDQILFAVFLRTPENLIFLKKRLLSKHKMFVVLPKMIAKWRDGATPTAEETIEHSATLTTVKEFLREH